LHCLWHVGRPYTIGFRTVAIFFRAPVETQNLASLHKTKKNANKDFIQGITGCGITKPSEIQGQIIFCLYGAKATRNPKMVAK
jgi:hypothetical protein